METSSILFAFGVTLFAGLSTGLGGLLAFTAQRDNPRILSVALGFSAGVMLYVSFVEILVKGRAQLAIGWGASGDLLAVLSFFGGIFFIGLIDKFIPEEANPHEVSSNIEVLQKKNKKGTQTATCNEAHLKQIGIFTAIAIAIHNFPEGLATFIATLSDPELGVAIAVAIAIHNIPEGVAVAIPIYYATGCRKQALVHATLSGLAEPLGALIGFLLLMPFLSPTLFGVLFSGIAGVMVFISLDKLLPTAEEYGEHHLCIYGLVGGMAVMAISLLLLA